MVQVSPASCRAGSVHRFDQPPRLIVIAMAAINVTRGRGHQSPGSCSVCFSARSRTRARQLHEVVVVQIAKGRVDSRGHHKDQMLPAAELHVARRWRWPASTLALYLSGRALIVTRCKGAQRDYAPLKLLIAMFRPRGAACTPEHSAWIAATSCSSE
jgi:hypothetical protein